MKFCYLKKASFTSENKGNFTKMFCCYFPKLGNGVSTVQLLKYTHFGCNITCFSKNITGLENRWHKKISV